MIKKIKSRNTVLWAAVFLLIATGLAGIATGAVISVKNNKDMVEIESFTSLVNATQEAYKEKDYGELSTKSYYWEYIARNSKNTEITSKASYNKGWTNLRRFIKEEEDINAYRAARGDFRESLRKNPDFSDAKHNLAYAENLAKKRGIEPEEIPISKDAESPSSRGTGPAKGLGSGTEEEKTDDPKAELKYKLRGGGEHGIGGKPPGDIHDEPTKEDILENPDGEY